MYIIGDLHGNSARHIELCNLADQENECTLQIGDLGYNYDYLKDINSAKHWFVGGNHENYEDVASWGHYLGDFGHVFHGKNDFFFVRGEFSIDKKYRERMYYSGRWPRTWFPEEEIPLRHHKNVIDSYKAYINKSKRGERVVIISHGCPHFLAKEIGNEDQLLNWGFNPETFTTNTQILLQKLYEEREPDLWFFGHWHQDLSIVRGNTRFVCIKDQNYIKVNKKWEITHE